MGLAMGAHLVVNRSVASIYVASRSHRSLEQQMKLMWRELHWGYMTAYLVSMMIALLYKDIGWPALFMGMLTQYGLFRAVSYYSRMHHWQQQALRDALTGLENRVAWNLFAESIEKSIPSSTLAVIDLDRFKEVNDRFGHAVGDRVLQDVGIGLNREQATTGRAFRYGGDEFVVYATHGEQKTEAAVRRFLKLVRELNTEWESQGLPVRASIGVASAPADGVTLGALFQVADQRMYEAKGHNRTEEVAAAEEIISAIE